jgi:anti-sigma-K factor RskA
MAQQQQQQQQEQLIAALTQMGGLGADVRLLREELRSMNTSVQNLTTQMVKFEAEHSAANFTTRLNDLERRVQALDLKEEKRAGGIESGANIWKYTTGVLALLMTAIGIAATVYLKTRHP